jgi:hypothetical protein
MRRLLGGLALAGLFGCGGPLEADGSPSRSLSIKVGQEIELDLHTSGPGEYASPPAVSSSSILFLDMRVVPPFLPSGPTQRFRFKAVTPGVAVIIFQHTEGRPTVEDTIIVR